MALTYPLEMPTSGFIKSRFRLDTSTSRNVLRSGATFGTQIAPQAWSVYMETYPLLRIDQGKWISFFDALKGGVKSCLLYDPARQYPIEYTDFTGLVKAGTSDPFTGVAVLGTINNVRSLDIEELPASFVLSRGDLVSFVETISGDVRYSLHRIVEDETADSNGDATITIEGPLPSFYTTSTTVNFYRPKGEFFVDADSIEGDDQTATPHPMSFAAKSLAY